VGEDRWRRLKRVFDRALALDPGRRSAFLATACGSDLALEEEVETLLAALEAAGAFLERPALDGGLRVRRRLPRKSGH
jgi:hypothetical protein